MSAWDSTPGPSGGAKRSRWDETPAVGGGAGMAMGATPVAGSMGFMGATPVGGFGMETPAAPRFGAVPMTAEQFHNMKWEKELWERNRPLTDDELDNLMPREGYKVVQPPANYEPIRTPARKLMATPTPMGGMTPMFQIPEEDLGARAQEVGAQPADLPEIKPEDQQFFGKLLQDVDEAELSVEQAKERRILKLLLKIKNGAPPQRKSALKQITDKAREFGASALFDQILPILMSPTTEDQERHLMVKVIDRCGACPLFPCLSNAAPQVTGGRPRPPTLPDPGPLVTACRILFKLQELVRPYVHKILIVVMPMLIDEDYYARVEGREIIANLAKAAGQAAMISALRPDIDNADEYVRNTAARAFAVVSSAFGVPTMVPFLK